MVAPSILRWLSQVRDLLKNGLHPLWGSRPPGWEPLIYRMSMSFEFTLICMDSFYDGLTP